MDQMSSRCCLGETVDSTIIVDRPAVFLESRSPATQNAIR